MEIDLRVGSIGLECSENNLEFEFGNVIAHGEVGMVGLQGNHPRCVPTSFSKSSDELKRCGNNEGRAVSPEMARLCFIDTFDPSNLTPIAPSGPFKRTRPMLNCVTGG